MLLVLMILVFLSVALFWIWYFYRKDKGEKEPKKLIFFAFLASIGAVLAGSELIGFSDFIFENLIGTSVSQYIPSSGIGLTETPKSFSIILLFGLQLLIDAGIEEIVKFLALFLFLRDSRFFNEVTDGIFYGIVIGLGFAFIEDLSYLFMGGLGAGVRVMDILFHPATIGFVGYFWAKNKILGASFKPVIFALLGMTFLHALRNWLNFWPEAEWAGVLVFGITAFLYGELFILYSQAQKVSANIFCTKCGFKNRASNIFCTHCGNRLSK